MGKGGSGWGSTGKHKINRCDPSACSLADFPLGWHHAPAEVFFYARQGQGVKTLELVVFRVTSCNSYFPPFRMFVLSG